MNSSSTHRSDSAAALLEVGRRAARFAGEVLAETLWPTRCAVCDVPGAVLCERCERDLPYLDWWRACRRCGSAYGFVQCDRCNEIALSRIGRTSLPYDGCASATMFDGQTGRIVRVFKDQGEQRLATAMAVAMARAVPRDWAFDAIAFVPATLAAYRHRGFDHGQLLAEALEGVLGTPCVPVLDRPRTRDQRILSGSQRVRNLSGSFYAPSLPRGVTRLLLVDDVHTTGATLCAATDALIAAGAQAVYGLTFARV